MLGQAVPFVRQAAMVADFTTKVAKANRVSSGAELAAS
jgi:hypothetical protein